MIRSSSAVAIAATVAATLVSAQPTLAQDESDQRLGRVHFAIACNETAQRRFDRAMRYQHSVWYRQAKEIFEDVAKADPECGMAFWGIALTLLNNPHGAPPASNLPLGLAAIQKAMAIGAKTQRERDYIDALAVMYVDYDKIDHRSRVQAYLKAMEALAARYPEDDEAQIAYAITLNVAASPADKTYANQLKGAAILEPIFKRQPQHRGAACAAYAVAHLYPRRLLEGVDYRQPSLGACGQSRQSGDRSAARPGLHGVRLSAARAGQECARRHRRHGASRQRPRR